MQIETDNIMIGLAWDLEKAEAILEDHHENAYTTLPVIVLAVTAPDEELARSRWHRMYPHLEINTIVPLNTLIDEGAVS